MASFGSPMKLAPSSPKRSKSTHSWNKCIICQCSSKEPLINMRNVSRSSFISSMEIRKDLVFSRVLTEVSSIDQLRSDEIKVVYHRSCYKSYTSKHNCSVFMSDSSISTEVKTLKVDVTSESRSNVLTRSQFQSIRWDRCFICQNKSFKKDVKLHKIESEDRMNKILNSALKTCDDKMIQLVKYEGFLQKAVYHNGCMMKFLLKTPTRKCDSECSNIEPSCHDTAFQSLIAEVNDDLIIHKKVFLMTQLLDRYKSYLPQDIAKVYLSAKLQERLQKHYGDKISIKSQRGQGMSNLVFSSELSIGAAIAAAGNYKTKLKSSEVENSLSCDSSAVNDEQVLHSAAGILRREIEKSRFSNEDYPSASQLSLAASMDMLPYLLVKFVSWVIDGKLYENAVEPYAMPIEKARKAVGISDCIVSVSKQAFTPFHLGLAVQLYHEFGSRRLIETLYSHGVCVSYDEVRRYITSIAHHEIEKIQNDVYVPDGIVPVQEGGCLIQEGADNIDLNTETVDGKDSFHSMARAVFQTNYFPVDSCLRQLKVKRGPDRSLEITENASKLSSCLPFNKPKTKCSPNRVPNAVGKIFDCAANVTNASELLWVILRCTSRDIPHLPVQLPTDQHIPFWSGYNSSLSEYKSEFTLVSYAPIIDSKPSDMSTVYTTMKKCSDMTKSMGQLYSVQTFDQQLYAIAKACLKLLKPIY